MSKHFMAFFLLSVFFCRPAQAQDNPREIVQKSYQLYRQVSNEKEQMEVDIEYKDGRKEQKVLCRWIQYDRAGEDKVTTIFSKPPRENGLGLLIWRHAKSEDDQWLKLPSMKEVRRISVSDQSKYFAGTDITYEDSRQLVGEKTEDFDYELLGHEGDSWIIQSVPRPKAESAYVMRRIWVDGKFAIAKIEYYDKSGILKTLVNKSLKYLEGGSWRFDEAEIENKQLNRRTIIRVTERNLNTDIPSKVFSKSFIESAEK